MTLPTFLGIGAPKAGTTWLYNLLVEHPQVYVSQRLKEVSYFNRNYDRGQAWYESFFPDESEASAYCALGEVTPSYLHCEQCPERIDILLDNPKLIAILRSPADRAWSNYLFRVRLDNYQGSFENYLVEYPGGIRRSYYAQAIRNYLTTFARDQLLILIFEQVFDDIAGARDQIAGFLEINAGDFPAQAGFAKINKSYVPRFGRVYALSTRILAWASRRQQYWLINGAKRFGVKKALSMGGQEAPMSMKPETRLKLQALFSQDIDELEELLDVDLSRWRK